MSSEAGENVSPESPSTPQLVVGYPTLAAYMGATPEITIVRRFADLNTQTLLYYQAELFYLEAQLREIEAAASRSGESDPKSRFARDWEWLGAVDLNGGVNEHMNILLRIRAVVKEYNELVLQQAGLATLPKPGRYDLRYLQQWLSDPFGGNFPLEGPDRNWTYASDLLALRCRAESDPFSNRVCETLLPFYNRICGRYIHKKNPYRCNEVSYKDSVILRVASMLATALAALLIVAPVVVLDEISSMRAKLGLMSAFTVLFSLCITRLTNAKRTEIFAATAAFAAVQAVFLGSNNVPSIVLAPSGAPNRTSVIV